MKGVLRSAPNETSFIHVKTNDTNKNETVTDDGFNSPYRYRDRLLQSERRVPN